MTLKVNSNTLKQLIKERAILFSYINMLKQRQKRN